MEASQSVAGNHLKVETKSCGAHQQPNLLPELGSWQQYAFFSVINTSLQAGVAMCFCATAVASHPQWWWNPIDIGKLVGGSWQIRDGLGMCYRCERVELVAVPSRANQHTPKLEEIHGNHGAYRRVIKMFPLPSSEPPGGGGVWA